MVFAVVWVEELERVLTERDDNLIYLQNASEYHLPTALIYRWVRHLDAAYVAAPILKLCEVMCTPVMPAASTTLPRHDLKAEDVTLPHSPVAIRTVD